MFSCEERFIEQSQIVTSKDKLSDEGRQKMRNAGRECTGESGVTVSRGP